jgi:hypothetical protein
MAGNPWYWDEQIDGPFIESAPRRKQEAMDYVVQGYVKSPLYQLPYI